MKGDSHSPYPRERTPLEEKKLALLSKRLHKHRRTLYSHRSVGSPRRSRRPSKTARNLSDELSNYCGWLGLWRCRPATGAEQRVRKIYSPCNGAWRKSTQSAKCVYVKRLPGVAEWTTLLAVLLLRTPRLTCVAQITDQMMLWDLTSSDVRLTYYEQDESATTPSEG